jgi:hypothetical protein
MISYPGSAVNTGQTQAGTHDVTRSHAWVTMRMDAR